MRPLLSFRRLALASVPLLAACIGGHVATRADHPVPLATVLVMDSAETSAASSVPARLSDRIGAALDQRNLKASPLAAEEWNQPFSQKRTTAARLAVLAADAPRAEALLLVETKALFYSLLNGRFRWTVHTRVSFAKKDALNEPLTTEFELPVYLDFEHEKEQQALEAAAPSIADEVGKLADQFIAGTLTPAVATKAPSGRRPAPSIVAVKTPKPKRPQHAPERSDESIYFVLVDRFENGDKSNDGEIDLKDPQAFHGGDLQGVINRLDYLQGLGVRTVWLSPVFKMRTQKLDRFGAFHGYWVEDFGRIEPRFGDEALLKKLADELHAHGMKLVLDVVLNHVGYDAPLVQAHPEWFHHNGDIKDWNDRKQLETYDVHGLPDLAQEREDVYQYLLKTSIKWIDEVHPDGFRLDAVKHVPLSFWARYNEDIRKHAGENFLLLGEDLDGDPQQLAKTLQDGKFTSVFDFPLHFAMVDVFCKDAPAGKLAAMLYQDRAYAHPELLATLLDNHDLARLQTSCGGDERRVRNALAFLLLSRGIPTLMYGTEAGLAGDKEPANRADMAWDKAPFKDEIARLLAVRRESPEFFAQHCTPIRVEEKLFACASVREDEALVVALNQGSERASVSLDKTKASAVDLLSGKATNEGRIDLEPHAFQAFLLHAKAGADLRTIFPAASTKAAPVCVRVRGAPVEQGDTLALVGSGAELGNWNPAQGFGPAKADGGTFSLCPEIQGDAVFEYKLVLRKKDGRNVWEPRPNRILRGGTPDSELIWGSEQSPAPLTAIE